MRLLSSILILFFALVCNGAGLGVYNPAQHAVNGFMPTQLPGLVFWYDAGRECYTNSTSVDRITDWSANGCHATNNSSSSYPQYTTQTARPSLTFDGVDDYLIVSNASVSSKFQGVTNITVISVTLHTINGLQQSQLSIGTPTAADSRFRVGLFSSANPFIGGRRLDGDSFVQINAANSIATNAISVFTFTGKYNVSNALCFVNSKTQINAAWLSAGSVSNTPSARVVIGASPGFGFPLNGKLFEMLAFNNEVSDSDRAKVERYLGTKYGIVVQ